MFGPASAQTAANVKLDVSDVSSVMADICPLKDSTMKYMKNFLARFVQIEILDACPLHGKLPIIMITLAPHNQIRPLT
ncbi:hypothetical protein FHS74_000701 [Nitrospirillum iridis]|uniref:Uncharacterized protein n=1 Tax=Nitrospirillum iridis TaxID=765888 RepID=A0A7X0AU67_9PROT|nr:hypothetical protein [Nitrospirillum iridis]